jgi:hypothetical protein
MIACTQYPVSPAVSSITRIQYHRRYSVSRAVLIHPLYPVSPVSSIIAGTQYHALYSYTRCIQYHPYPVSSPVLSITRCTHTPKIPNCWIRNTGNTGLVITHRVGIMRHYFKMNDRKPNKLGNSGSVKGQKQLLKKGSKSPSQASHQGSAVTQMM